MSGAPLRRLSGQGAVLCARYQAASRWQLLEDYQCGWVPADGFVATKIRGQTCHDQFLREAFLRLGGVPPWVPVASPLLEKCRMLPVIGDTAALPAQSCDAGPVQ